MKLSRTPGLMPFVEQMTDPIPSGQPSLIQEMTIKGCEPHNGYDCGPTQNQKKFSSWAGHNLETVFYKECLLGETETERRTFKNFYQNFIGQKMEEHR